MLTDKGMVALKNYLSEVPADYFKASMKLNEIPMLFTVETFCKLIVEAMAAKNAREVAA